MKKIIGILATVITLAFPLSASAFSYDILNGETLLGIAEDYQLKNYRVADYNIDLMYPTQPQPEEEKEMYTVEKGDTLYGISKEYNVSIEELKSWNNLASDLILIGQELITEEPEEKDVAIASHSIQPKEVKISSTNIAEGKTMTVIATAYTAECKGCTGITFTGINLNEDRHAKVIAVDPTVIPLGSKVYVEGYGYAIAGDIGSAIKGNRIDVHLPTKTEAFEWGVKEVKITIVE